MFNLEIEKKIIEFVKKGPLGVTSSEIANYVGLNRMTITKYLAIIKERALIDFKQFGMAKLWYIPIKLSKETFLSKIMTELTENIPQEQFKTLSENAGKHIGKDINQKYLNFIAAKKLNPNQITDVLADIGNKLDGNFKTKLGDDKISVEIIQSPFDKNNIKAMNNILSAVFAKIVSINLGYARVKIIRPVEGKNTVIDIYFKKKLI